MGLESATYISELIATNPVGAVDDYATADDHLRLIKGVLQNQFPNFAAAAVNLTDVELNLLDGLLANAAEINTLDGYTGNTADLNVLAGAAVGGLTAAELLFVAGVTSDIQTQLNARALSARQIISGIGITGGGDLTGDRTLDLDVPSLPTVVTPAAADAIAMYDDDAAAHKKMLISALEAVLSHANIANVVANEHIDHSSVSLSSGQGIQAAGLGDLTASRTITAESAAEGTKGVAEIATQTEVDTGTDDTRMVTPAKLRSAANKFVHKTADETVSTSTTFQDDDHLTGLAMDSNTFYRFECFLDWKHLGGNIKFQFIFTNGIQDTIKRIDSFDDLDNVDIHINGVGVAHQITTFGVGTSNTLMTGFIWSNATTGGTIKLQWAQQTSHASPTTIRRGSYIKLEKMP